MNSLLTLLLLLSGVVALTLLVRSLRAATIAGVLALLLLGMVAHGVLATIVVAIGWALWVVVAACNLPDLRRRFIVRPAFHAMGHALPAMSSTERAALEAGTVWFEAELFNGHPDWRRLLDLPRPGLSTAEQAFLDGPVERLCAMLDDWTITHERGDLPPEVWRFIKEQGFLGMIIPSAYGGLGFSARAHSAVILKLASRCGAAAISVMVPNSLGPAELLLRYGTQDQRDHYLPRLARGEELPCFALTNPFAGSDAAGIPDRGVVCRSLHQGEEVLGMRLTWEKRYITLGPVATLLGLAFQLHDPDHLLGDQVDLGITLALLPTTHPGVVIGRRHWPSGQAFQNGPTSGHEVFIPLDWVIGGRERCGDGWRMLMNCLAAGRAISLPALSTAALKVCASTTGAYAFVRQQFGLPIAKFEGVQEALARIAANTYAVDAARELTLGALDLHEEPAIVSALLKYQATERMRAAINDAMDIHGGRAVCDGPRNYLLAAYRAAPVAITVEGANILTRSLIVFGQGAIRCHPWLLKEMAALADPDPARGLDAFEPVVISHLAGVARTAARALWLNVTRGRAGRSPLGAPGHAWFAELDRTSVSFALVVEGGLAQLGGSLKRREMLSGRFADILSELYLMSAVLKRFEDDGRPAEDRLLLDYVCAQGLYVIQTRLDEILANLPNRWLSVLLRALVLPWGRYRRPPSDALTAAVANLLSGSREGRARVSRGIYVDPAPDDVIGCLEHAVSLVQASDEAARTLRRALAEGRVDATAADPIEAAMRASVLSGQDAAKLRETAAAVRRVIDVDDFDPAALWCATRNASRAQAA